MGADAGPCGPKPEENGAIALVDIGGMIVFHVAIFQVGWASGNYLQDVVITIRYIFDIGEGFWSLALFTEPVSGFKSPVPQTHRCAVICCCGINSHVGGTGSRCCSKIIGPL